MKETSSILVEQIKAFPTLVLRVGNFLSPKECESILNLYRHDTRLGIYPTVFPGKSRTTYGTKIVKIHLEMQERIPELKDFEERLKASVNEYCVIAGHQPGLGITSTIINFQNKGSQLGEHAHPGSILSGSIYVRADKDCNSIVFRNPNPYVKLHSVCYPNEYSSDTMWVKPQSGDLIIFPSWLQHSSGNEINNSEERVCIAFNTNYGV